MSTQSKLLGEILARQIKPSFRMIEKVINACPKSIWAQKNIDPPIWQQVYHILYGLDYWFSATKESFEAPKFRNEVNSVLGEDSDGFIDQEEIMDYKRYVAEKVELFISGMNDEALSGASKLYEKWTNLDVILEQMRHFQHHLGYLNRVLLKCKISPIEWEYFEE